MEAGIGTGVPGTQPGWVGMQLGYSLSVAVTVNPPLGDPPPQSSHQHPVKNKVNEAIIANSR